LGVSPWTLRRLVADGQLSFLPGKFLRFDRQELDAYISREKIRL
jgi:excisionase family DNA binding protein